MRFYEKNPLMVCVIPKTSVYSCVTNDNTQVLGIAFSIGQPPSVLVSYLTITHFTPSIETLCVIFFIRSCKILTELCFQ